MLNRSFVALCGSQHLDTSPRAPPFPCLPSQMNAAPESSTIVIRRIIFGTSTYEVRFTWSVNHCFKGDNFTRYLPGGPATRRCPALRELRFFLNLRNCFKFLDFIPLKSNGELHACEVALPHIGAHSVFVFTCVVHDHAVT